MSGIDSRLLAQKLPERPPKNAFRVADCRSQTIATVSLQKQFSAGIRLILAENDSH